MCIASPVKEKLSYCTGKPQLSQYCSPFERSAYCGDYQSLVKSISETILIVLAIGTCPLYRQLSFA